MLQFHQTCMELKISGYSQLSGINLWGEEKHIKQTKTNKKIVFILNSRNVREIQLPMKISLSKSNS